MNQPNTPTFSAEDRVAVTRIGPFAGDQGVILGPDEQRGPDWYSVQLDGYNAPVTIHADALSPIGGQSR
jgi:transcription antitermination factor NusG